MPPALLRRLPLWGVGLVLVWLLQVAWLAWHFTPDGRDLTRRLGAVLSGAGLEQEDPLETWLEEVARLLPPTSTYIFLDCYETGQYAKVRYRLHPREQVRLDPKTSPVFLFDRIQRRHATFVLVGGCQTELPWQSALGADQTLFRPLASSELGRVFAVDPAIVQGGFYD